MNIKYTKINTNLPDLVKHGNGIDLYSGISTILLHGEYKWIPTGMAFELNDTVCGLILGRSGLAYNNTILVPHTGLIDSDYTGEVKVLLHNAGLQSFTITEGMRIAQMLIVPQYQIQTILAHTLPLSERGVKGFGSTGL